MRIETSIRPNNQPMAVVENVGSINVVVSDVDHTKSSYNNNNNNKSMSDRPEYHNMTSSVGGDNDDGGNGFKKDMRDLEEMLSKLNPMAEEFVPLHQQKTPPQTQFVATQFGYNFLFQTTNNGGFANATPTGKVSIYV